MKAVEKSAAGTVRRREGNEDRPRGVTDDGDGDHDGDSDGDGGGKDGDRTKENRGSHLRAAETATRYYSDLEKGKGNWRSRDKGEGQGDGR